ncbi:MAG TPA: ABC transporter permease subunit [Salinisphaeraceae bacterium]|nr:ABC transporter permease subunit [Salinisphaeraceae bacterium]
MNRLPLSYPAALLVAAAALSPIVVLLLLGFEADIDLGSRATEIALNTILLTLLTATLATLIGVPLALLTTHAHLPGRRLLLVLLAAPLAVPSYLGAFAFFAAFGSGGAIEVLTGIPTPRVHGLWGTTVVMALYTYPFVMLSTRAALHSLDGSVVDAARTLGLTPYRVLFRIVLPRARNGIAAGALLVALYALSDFATPTILGLDTFTRIIYVEYNAFGLDRAALLSLQLLTLVAVVLLLETRVRVPRERSGRPSRLPCGGFARAGTALLAGLVFCAAIMLPIALFTLWLVRTGAAHFEFGYALNSAYAALLAAGAVLLAALPVAYAATSGWLGRLCERITYLGFGVPGIVMGTALVYLGLRIPFLYQTLALLVLAYVLRFLPLAVGNIRASTERLESNMLGAARSLGATPGEAFRRISLPLITPGIIAATALVFLEAMRELPATLLLRPTGFETLATYLWRVYSAGYIGRGAVPALALVIVSGIALLLMLTGEASRNRAMS